MVIGRLQKQMNLVNNDELADISDTVSEAVCGRSHIQSEDICEKTVWQRPQSKRRRRSYINFTKVAEIFPDVTTDVLCQVAELEDVTPSAVYSLVPSATSKQILFF